MDALRLVNHFNEMTNRSISHSQVSIFVQIHLLLFDGANHPLHISVLGGLAGLAPTPYASGDSYHDQGISKAGNRWVRAMMVELAWCWLQYQPQSALTRWYSEKYDQAGKSERKKGIVALARKLLIAYWHFLDKGLVPEGALLKSVL